MFKNKNAKGAEFGSVNIKCILYLEPEQQTLLNKHFGHSRFVYNWAIDYNRELYKKEKRSLSYTELAKQLPLLKKDKKTSFLKEVDSTSLQQALQDYSQSFGMFLQKKAGYPKYRSKNKKETFRVINVKIVDKKTGVVSESVRIDGDKIKIGKFGWVRTKPNQVIPDGEIQYITVNRTKTGKVFATLTIRRSKPTNSLPKTGKEAGGDTGIKNFLVLTDGTVIPKPGFVEKDDKKIRRLQRELSRKQKGSKNRRKALEKLNIACEKDKNRREDFLNKLSTELVREYDLLVFEHLNIRGMLTDGKSKHRHKQIGELGWYTFMQKVKYKAEWYGKTFIQVDTYFPSSQLCSHCGHKNPAVKDLNVRKWICPVCGTEHDRDRNASINILKEGKRILSEKE